MSLVRRTPVVIPLASALERAATTPGLRARTISDMLARLRGLPVDNASAEYLKRRSEDLAVAMRGLAPFVSALAEQATGAARTSLEDCARQLAGITTTEPGGISAPALANHWKGQAEAMQRVADRVVRELSSLRSPDVQIPSRESIRLLSNFADALTRLEGSGGHMYWSGAVHARTEIARSLSLGIHRLAVELQPSERYLLKKLSGELEAVADRAQGSGRSSGDCMPFVQAHAVIRDKLRELAGKASTSPRGQRDPGAGAETGPERLSRLFPALNAPPPAPTTTPPPPAPPPTPRPTTTTLAPTSDEAKAAAISVLPTALQPMVKLGLAGDARDLELMAKHLAALNPAMLKALQAAGYTFRVARYRVSNSEPDLKDSTINSNAGGPFLVDLAEGVHRVTPGSKPSITVRTYLKDGVLRLDASTLMHEIGHAFDLVVDAAPVNSPLQVRALQPRRSARATPVNTEPDFAVAYSKEHQLLPQYFHSQGEFFPETFALFMLDPVRCRRQFPLAFAAHKRRFAALLPAPGALLELEKEFDRPAIVTTTDLDLRKQLAFAAQQNRVLREAGLPAQPIVVHLQGKPDWGTEAYVQDASRHVRNSFGTEAGVYRPSENFQKLSPATLNDASEMERLLTELETSGRPAVLFVPDAATVQANAPGFAVYNSFIERHRDVPPLVIAGESRALSALDAAVSSMAPRLRARVEALTGTQQVELVRRLAAQDGRSFDTDVAEALAKKLKGGGYSAAEEAWRKLKAAQFERLLESEAVAELPDLLRLTLDDVQRMKWVAKKTPQERLDALVGQEGAKQQIRAIALEAKMAALRASKGLPEPSPLRLNLLFSGSPGTGKTSFAEILGELLQEVGYLRNPSITKVTIQDLVSGSPEAAVKALFENNRGGLIFIDEMHQLKDTAEGIRAYRALIPYMTDPSYADTVFVGAGYRDELGDLLRNFDAGGERRYTEIDFVDYKRDELSAIVDLKAKELHLTLDAEARQAALDFIDYRKRITKNFGNAGEVDVALTHARKAQTLRLADLPASSITMKQLQSLEAGDFTRPRVITKDEFWGEMNRMSGWDDIKKMLRKMAATIEAAEKAGKAPTDAVEPYWIVEGPRGTGKTALSELLAKFGAAYGLIALPQVVSANGASFQGEFVGQTAGAVQKQFEKAWGRLLFLDEASGLARSGGQFKDEAAKTILTQTENHRGKFMMVVADYPENINQFLRLDGALAGRFGNRVMLEAWTASEAAKDLVEKLAREGIAASGVAKRLEERFSELARQPGYASGRDVRTLKTAILAEIVTAPENLSAKARLEQAIETAFDDLMERKRRDEGPASENSGSAAPVASAVATKAAEKAKEAPHGPSAADRKVIAAMDATNKKLAQSLNGLSMAELERVMSDPKSAYGKELAKALGTKAEQAVKLAKMVRMKVKKLVQSKEVVRRFVYHCPFCGGIESPTCGYMSQPLEWKIQHSLKKPWDEVKVTTREVEVVEERRAEI